MRQLIIDELTKTYIDTFEALMEAEHDLEKEFEKAKEALPERAAYRKAEAALSEAVRKKEKDNAHAD